MFGKKELKKESLPDIKIDKIPDDFYAGMNPVIKFTTVEKEIQQKNSSDILTPLEKKDFDKKTAVGAGNNTHPVNLFSSWKFLLVGSLVIIVVGGAVMGSYYYWQYKKQTSPKNLVNPPPVSSTTNDNNIVKIEQNIDNAQNNQNQPSSTLVTAINNVLNDPGVEFPSSLLADGEDNDRDGISDYAEIDFNSDPGNPDTDGDKYTDGHEVENLYNPNGVEPMKLIDSGIINNYSSQLFSYQLYYPKNWAVGSVDSSGRDVLFSTVSGENIEVRAFENQNVDDWFGKYAQNERFSDYVPYRNVFGINGLVRKDGLVYILSVDNRIFSLIYHTTDSTVVNYKIVIKMMANSFRIGQSQNIPNQILEQGVDEVQNQQ